MEIWHIIGYVVMHDFDFKSYWKNDAGIKGYWSDVNGASHWRRRTQAETNNQDAAIRLTAGEAIFGIYSLGIGSIFIGALIGFLALGFGADNAWSFMIGFASFIACWFGVYYISTKTRMRF